MPLMSLPGVDVLIVAVAQQRLALLTSAVDEVQPAALPTPLPGAPDIVEGLLDVRGDVIPVVEVRRRFGLPPRPIALDDCLVLTRADGFRLALRVDEAVDVTTVRIDDLAPHRAFAGAAYTTGTGVHDGDLLVVLDVERFLTEGEIGALHAALAQRRGRHD